MHEKIRIKHFSIEMIPPKNFAKINIKHFSKHLSGLKLFAKRKIKHVMSHSISRTMFYTYFFMHIKISPTGKSVLSFIPSGILPLITRKCDKKTLGVNMTHMYHKKNIFANSGIGPHLLVANYLWISKWVCDR